MIQYPLQHIPSFGKGSVMIDLLDASGLSTGYIHMGNCSKFDQEIKDDKAELYQSINGVPTLIASAVKKRQLILSITGTDFAFTHLAIQQMASGGKQTVLSTGTTPVVAEALASATATKKGKFFSTIGRNIGAVTVKQGVTTLVLNTDYQIADALQGLIYFLPAGAVDDSAAVTIDYTPAALSLSQISGAVAPFVKAKIRFIPDPTDGQKIGGEWWKVNLSPNGKLALISDDYGNWELEGMVLDDSANHPTDPYYLLTDYGVVGQSGDVS